MPRKMIVTKMYGKMFGTYDGISWFLLAEPGKVPFPEKIYQPDLKYERGGRMRAIRDLRDCFSK